MKRRKDVTRLFICILVYYIFHNLRCQGANQNERQDVFQAQKEGKHIFPACLPTSYLYVYLPTSVNNCKDRIVDIF